jgi:hypothetical protein
MTTGQLAVVSFFDVGVDRSRFTRPTSFPLFIDLLVV